MSAILRHIISNTSISSKLNNTGNEINKELGYFRGEHRDETIVETA